MGEEAWTANRARICSLLLPSTAAYRRGHHRRPLHSGYAATRNRTTFPAASSARMPRTPRWRTARRACCSPLRRSVSPRHPWYQRRHHRAVDRGQGCEGHAEVLLSPCQPHQRNPEIHRHRLRPAAVHADGGIGARGADGPGNQDGAQDAPKPDQPALPVQHHQHHASFTRTDPYVPARCCASSRSSTAAR